jgi:hypothetical protein
MSWTKVTDRIALQLHQVGSRRTRGRSCPGVVGGGAEEVLAAGRASAGHRSPRWMQRLLGEAVWDAEMSATTCAGSSSTG